MQHDPAEYARGMKRLRKALEARIRADDRAERRETHEAAKRKADGDLVSYDYRGLAARLKPALSHDGRGYRAIAADIGVTSPDLSRIMAGQGISVEKVIAICDWLRIDVRRFYRPLKGKRPTCRRPRRRPARASEGFTGAALKQECEP